MVLASSPGVLVDGIIVLGYRRQLSHNRRVVAVIATCTVVA